MATTPTYPGVYIQELTSDVHPITGVATSVCAFVGYTATGIDNRPEQIFSFSDYIRLFGGLAANSEVSYAVQQFFANGGTTAWVVRTPSTSSGAVGATITFGDMKFTALSSGASANGKLLVDVDFNNIPSASSASGFNLTITNLADGTVESFPNVSILDTQTNYYVNIVNDPDNGSGLVSVADGSPGSNTLPVATGVISPVVVPANSSAAMAGTTAVVGTMDMTAGSRLITGHTTTFGTDVKVGNWLQFAADVTNTWYQIGSVPAGGLSLNLTTAYTGATETGSTAITPKTTIAATANSYGVKIKLYDPSSPLAPFPLDVPVFTAGVPLPQTVAGLAAQLQKAINGALALQMQGASVTCSVITTTTSAGIVTQQIAVNAMVPTYPDAVIQFAAPTTPNLSDATQASVLGFSTVNSNVAHYALGTLNNYMSTTSTAGSSGTALPATADLIGAQTVPPTGIYALESVAIFNLLCIPEATRATAGNPAVQDPTVDPNAVFSAALTLCDPKRAMLLIDCPPSVNTVSAAVDWRTSGLTVSDPNGAAFFPRLRLPDPLNNYALRTFAPCGVVAGLYARTDASRGVWKAPAGIEATLTGVQQLVYKMTDAEQGVLNPLGLNCFRNFPVYGSVLWGARTLWGADALANQWKYVPVRRVALFLESSLWQGTQWVVFEPNDDTLWASIRLNIGSFMQNLFIQGYFQGTTPAQAYFVKCDGETTTQTDIDNGIVNIVVGFAPLEPAEFVVIQIQQMSGQTAS